MGPHPWEKGKMTLRKQTADFLRKASLFKPKKRRTNGIVFGKDKDIKGTDIEKFIEFWKRAWEEGALQRYISCYDNTFQSGGIDLQTWIKRRSILNRKHRDIKIEIIDLEIERISDQTAHVNLKLNYKAEGYQTFGLKRLSLVKKEKFWHIKTEDWTPLKQSGS